MVSREKIHELVRLFYQHTYKTFYINSTDGQEFEKPLGVFISLGMTTSKKTLENIRDFIGANKEYSARIVRISSKRLDDQFLNTVLEEPAEQFAVEEIPETVLTKEEALEELENLKNDMSLRSSLELLTEHVHRVKKLQHLINQLEESDGWDFHMIQRDGDLDYRIFHRYVNYEHKDGIEYRLGIFVDEKSN